MAPNLDLSVPQQMEQHDAFCGGGVRHSPTPVLKEVQERAEVHKDQRVLGFLDRTVQRQLVHLLRNWEYLFLREHLLHLQHRPGSGCRTPEHPRTPISSQKLQASTKVHLRRSPELRDKDGCSPLLEHILHGEVQTRLHQEAGEEDVH